MIKKILPIVLLCAVYLAEAQDCAGIFPADENVVVVYQSRDAKGKPTVKSEMSIKRVADSTDFSLFIYNWKNMDMKDRDLGSVEFYTRCQNGFYFVSRDNLMNQATETMDMQMLFQDIIYPTELNEGDELPYYDMVNITNTTYEKPVKEVIPRSVGFSWKMQDVSVFGSGATPSGGCCFGYGRQPVLTANVTTETVTKMVEEKKVTVMTMRTDKRKVEKMEKVKVPAGTFDCYKISAETKMYFNEASFLKALTAGGRKISETTEWIAPGIGMVKTETKDPKGKTISSTEAVKVIM